MGLPRELAEQYALPGAFCLFCPVAAGTYRAVIHGPIKPMKGRFCWSIQLSSIVMPKGFRDGIPIGLGYLSVSFTFGMMAVSMGLPVWAAVLISMTNLTSAGQFAGLSHCLRRTNGGDGADPVHHQSAVCPHVPLPLPEAGQDGYHL